VATDLEKWADGQVRAAVARGINPLDATKAVKDFLRLLPPGADPDTYIVPPRQLEQVLADEAVIADARSAWFGEVDSRYARILDATESDE
jgi:hypothetical protein